MAPISSLRAPSRYVITEAGHEASVEPGRCDCQVALAGLLLMCHKCDTVYGSLRDMSVGRFAVPKGE